MFQNGGKAFGESDPWTPFLEKKPPKITEGGPFDPHWPISRIKPAQCLGHRSWLGFSRYFRFRVIDGLYKHINHKGLQRTANEYAEERTDGCLRQKKILGNQSRQEFLALQHEISKLLSSEVTLPR